MIKKVIILLILPIYVFAFFDFCVPASCNNTIHYAMNKQREAIENRFNDLINVIEANDAEESKQTLYLTKETIEAMRLKERIRIDLYLIMEQEHYTDNLKEKEINKK